MLTNANTRIILDSKTVANVSKFNISYDYKENHPSAVIELKDGSRINTTLVSLEHNKENAFTNDGVSIDRVQYICEK